MDRGNGPFCWEKTTMRNAIVCGILLGAVAMLLPAAVAQFAQKNLCARISEIVLRDERVVVPIGSYNSRHDVTLSLPSIVRRKGCLKALYPPLSDDERVGLEKCVETLRKAQERTL
jgi:L-lactate dehydrogenase